MFLEYAAGGELFDRIEPDIGMPPHQAQKYFRELIDGVVSIVHLPQFLNVIVLYIWIITLFLPSFNAKTAGNKNISQPRE